MKYALLLCLTCLIFLANTCKQNTLDTELIGKVWLHSYEEDEGDVMVYRPNTFDFPPSRGRTGFALENGGVLKQYDIAPTDGLEEHVGKWSQLSNDRVRIQFDGNGQPAQDYILNIISVKEDVLKVKKSSPAGK